MPQHWLPTLTEAYNSFILDGESSRWTAHTLDHYRYRLGAFLRFLESHTVDHIADITPTHIRQHLLELKQRGLSSYSQHAAARTIRTWLIFCVREELLTDTPMRKVSMPKLDKKVLPHLSPEEVRRLLDSCETPRETAFILFLIDTCTWINLAQELSEVREQISHLVNQRKVTLILPQLVFEEWNRNKLPKILTPHRQQMRGRIKTATPLY